MRCHDLLLPRKGRYGLVDYEKAFCPDLKTGPDLFDLRGVDRAKGAFDHCAARSIHRQGSATGRL